MAQAGIELASPLGRAGQFTTRPSSQDEFFISLLFLNPCVLYTGFVIIILTLRDNCMCRNAYNMVLHSFGEKLYSGLVSTMTVHLQEIAASVEASNGPLFLEELNNKWAQHNKALHTIRDVVMYMDRTYVPSTHKTPVRELGLNLWRDNVIHSVNIQTRLQVTLLDSVQKERNGEVIKRDLMKDIIKMLMDLGPSVYQQVFEQPFLDASATFYRGESQRLIECCNCGEYLKKTEKCLNEEIDRVACYLDAKSEVKITNVVEKEMIESQMNCLVHMENSGLVDMIIEDKYDDLAWIYNFFRRLPNGLSVKDPVEFVQRLLEEKDKHDKIINLAFNNDKTFQNALNSSFEYFINLNQRSPEFISLFLDDKLRKGLESKEDVEVALDKVMMLVRYLKEKDEFEKYYKQHLATRLLSGISVSEDAERSLILKLKTECGYQFTSTLEGMFADMNTS
ncbi:putative cullin [Helianthus annuus]|nr:putative cullin [Helianthus annuus]